MDKYLECVKEMAKPTLQKWRNNILLSTESFVQRFDRISTAESRIAIRDKRGKLEFQSVDCCSEGVSFQALTPLVRSADARCKSLGVKFTPCDYDYMSPKYATRFMDDVARHIDEINRALIGTLFDLTFDALSTQEVKISDAQKGCSLLVKPNDDGIKLASISSALIGPAMLDAIINNFRDDNGLIDEITLVVPSGVVSILQQAFHERNKYCCEIKNPDWSTDNLLAFSMVYNNVMFHVYAENANYFSLKSTGGKTYGYAFVRDRMMLHDVDFYKQILMNGTGNVMMQDGMGDIIAISLEPRPTNSLNYGSIIAAMKVNVLRGSRNAGVLLEFTDSEIKDKAVSNNVPFINAPTFSNTLPTIVSSDAPYSGNVIETPVASVSANFNSDASDVASNKKTK